MGKHLSKTTGTDLLNLITWQRSLGCLALASAGLLVRGLTVNRSSYFLVAVVYNAVLCDSLAFLVWFYILKHMPADIAGIGLLGIPLLGVLASWLQFDESPGLPTGAGMDLIGCPFLCSTGPGRG